MRKPIVFGVAGVARNAPTSGNLFSIRSFMASRDAAVDVAAADRRQIERDLHDGVQQRLVTLAMDLGRAKDKMDTDPESAKELVGDTTAKTYVMPETMYPSQRNAMPMLPAMRRRPCVFGLYVPFGPYLRV